MGGATPRAPSVPHRPSLGDSRRPEMTDHRSDESTPHINTFKLASGGGSTTSASSSVSVDKMSLATTRTDTSESIAPVGVYLSPYEGGLDAVAPQIISGLQATSRSQSPADCCDIPLVATPRDTPYLTGHTDLQYPATPQRHLHTAGEDTHSSYIGANFAAVDGYSPVTATRPKIQTFARPSSTPQQHYSPVHLHTYHQAHRTSSDAAPQHAPYGYSRPAHWRAC